MQHLIHLAIICKYIQDTESIDKQNKKNSISSKKLRKLRKTAR